MPTVNNPEGINQWTGKARASVASAKKRIGAVTQTVGLRAATAKQAVIKFHNSPEGKLAEEVALIGLGMLPVGGAVVGGVRLAKNLAKTRKLKAAANDLKFYKGIVAEHAPTERKIWKRYGGPTAKAKVNDWMAAYNKTQRKIQIGSYDAYSHMDAIERAHITKIKVPKPTAARPEIHKWLAADAKAMQSFALQQKWHKSKASIASLNRFIREEL